MRARRKNYTNQLLLNATNLLRINEDFQKIFAMKKKITLEIGSGRGDFLIGMATKEQNKIFIGIEISETVLSQTLKKIQEEEISNLYFVRLDARKLLEYFPPSSIESIYLNFSDPWPKKRHAKRRLTSPMFLKIFDQLLENNGTIRFKTDNQNLYSFSQQTISECFEILEDNSNHQLIENEIISEYERRFRGRGQNIHLILAKKLS